jgi:hypothetical protein
MGHSLTSLISQRHERIDSGGAQNGKHRRSQSNPRKQAHAQNERERIAS